MSMLRYAKAKIVRHSLEADDWTAVRKDGMTGSSKMSRQAGADMIASKYNPEKFLLTHCTIIASVDVEASPVNDRGWPFVITAKTEKYVNNNEDAWERDLLLATYGTFRGAENYVEHIQIPELSKGKIVDAVARDLGETVYVDILVATDRKHKDLVRDIKSGEITTLSMGCTVDYTVCTKCGNVAEDDTQMCEHIKYMKGNHFFDKKGKRRKIAELCGHKDDEDSVTFIEASWVGNPAFKGAVMRNILEAADVSAETIKAAFETVNVVDADAMQRAASDLTEVQAALNKVESFVHRQGGFNFDDAGGDGGDGEGGEDKPAAPATPDKSPIDDITDDMKQVIRDQVRNQLRDEMRGVEKGKQDTGKENGNENLVRSTFAFSAFKSRYAGYGGDLMLYRLYEGLVSVKTAGWKSLSDKGFSGREILALSHFIDAERGGETLSRRANEAISKVGGTGPFESPLDYLNAIGKAAGIRKIPMDVARQLIYKGNLFSYGSPE